MPVKKRVPTRFRGSLQAAYRSGLEAAIAAALAAAKVPFAYEAYKVPFEQPAKSRTYTPDITLPNGIVVELKGLFVAEDRQKHLWVREQHPGLDLRFVFSSPAAKLRKGSPTTYADWCQKHGFQYAKKEIPKEWIEAPANQESLDALSRLGWTPSSLIPRTRHGGLKPT